jgi:hypothetical protein
MNEEFRKFFPQIDAIPILRVVETKRYWINESLLCVAVAGREYNIAQAVADGLPPRKCASRGLEGIR